MEVCGKRREQPYTMRDVSESVQRFGVRRVEGALRDRMVAMPLKFTGEAKIELDTGDLQLLAYLGEFPVRCIVKRAAVTAGLMEAQVSDVQALELYHARSGEIHEIASQRYDNGERQPTVFPAHMSMH